MPYRNPAFQTLFESCPGLYLVLAPDYTIVAVTEPYLAATMTKRQDILGKGLFEVFPDNPDDPDATGTSNLRASLERVLKFKKADTMAVQKYDIRRPASEGGGFEERHWSPMNMPILDAKGTILYILHKVEDVTDMVRLRQERIQEHQLTKELQDRAEQMDKLRQSQRMEAMGQLAGGVAHDFNNVLASIMMNCDNHLESQELSQAARYGFEQIRKACEKAAALTRQLLAFSRKQVLQPKPMSLNTAITGIEPMLRRLLNEDIVFECNLDAKLGTILADQVQIEQVLLNLVVNARDALPKGGKIIVETCNVELDKVMAMGQLKAEPGHYVMLSVRDTGIGMDALVQARLFEPFFTTKEKGKGTGLGLATVYGVVNQSKGTLFVYSEPGQGSVFKIYLPRVDAAPEAAPSPKGKAENLVGTENILVVEDQPDIREVVCKTLTQQGYKVADARNGVQALDMIEKGQRDFHLVITDVVMPEMNGRELAARLHQLLPKLKILYISGYTEDTLQNYGITGTHPEFLEKPFSRRGLLEKIRAILDDKV